MAGAVVPSRASKRGAKRSIGLKPGEIHDEADRVYRYLKAEDWPEICERAQRGESVDAEFIVAYMTPLDKWASTEAWMEYYDRQKALFIALGRLGEEFGCIIRPEIYEFVLTFVVGVRGE